MSGRLAMRASLVAGLVFGVAAGCDAPPESNSETDVRVDGPLDTVITSVGRGEARVVTHASLPEPQGDPLMPDLGIGVVDGDLAEVFGDLRAVEVDRDGHIYVLDHQTSEVRVFDPDGRHLRTITRMGEGPGELVAANGMTFAADGTLWIHDYGQWQMVGIDPQGEEVERVPAHVLGFGRFWSGALDHTGRFWKPTSWPVEPPPAEPEEGVQERRSRRYLGWFDPIREARDSVFIGIRTSRAYLSTQGGHRYFPIPYERGGGFAFDPEGGFWLAPRDEYRLVRLTPAGDTALVVEVEEDPAPVTSEDRAALVRVFLEEEPDARRTAEALAAAAPGVRPLIEGLFLDDEGRLWVRRGDDGGTVRFDVFDAEGAFLRAIRLAFEPLPGLAPTVRQGRLYAVVTGEMGVQRIVRTRLPEF